MTWAGKGRSIDSNCHKEGFQWIACCSKQPIKNWCYSVFQILSVLGLNHLKYSEYCINVQAVLAVIDGRLSNQSLDEWNADLHKELVKGGSGRNKLWTLKYLKMIFVLKCICINHYHII